MSACKNFNSDFPDGSATAQSVNSFSLVDHQQFFTAFQSTLGFGSAGTSGGGRSVRRAVCRGEIPGTSYSLDRIYVSGQPTAPVVFEWFKVAEEVEGCQRSYEDALSSNIMIMT